MRMSRAGILLISILLLVVRPGITNAQDLHFSQFYAVPLTLNPAMTGYFSDDYRVSGIYRNQWKSIHSTFETTSFGAEVNFKGGKLKKDRVGVGLLCYRDNLGDNILIGQSIILSSAYHKYLDVYERHSISGGIQFGFVQKSIDASKLIYADQFEDFKLKQDITSVDAMLKNQTSYVTLNIGTFYSFNVTPKTRVFTGMSVFQLNSPKESLFTTSSNNKLSPRYSFYSGIDYKLNALITLSPRFLYMNQQNGMDLNFGAYLGYHLGKEQEVTLYLGGWIRSEDAGIGMAGIKWANYTLRGSYDATFSNLRNISNASNVKASNTGAYEISLIIAGKLFGSRPSEFTIPCGIF